MKHDVNTLISQAVLEIINHTGSTEKLDMMKHKHAMKIHFIPSKYRVFGGLIQSMNIQFGNFIEVLMSLIIENEGKYEILTEYSGNRNNSFQLSQMNDKRIDEYITHCKIGIPASENEFSKLLQDIVADTDTALLSFKHDIDLLFRDKETNKVYYLEVKYNDDHDTGKFIDINRKFIKTYAYLARELQIKNSADLVPILFFFTNKKLKINPYIPETPNIKRGKAFFDEFLSLSYEEVEQCMNQLSESPLVQQMFDALYDTVMDL